MFGVHRYLRLLLIPGWTVQSSAWVTQHHGTMFDHPNFNPRPGSPNFPKPGKLSGRDGIRGPDNELNAPSRTVPPSRRRQHSPTIGTRSRPSFEPPWQAWQVPPRGRPSASFTELS